MKLWSRTGEEGKLTLLATSQRTSIEETKAVFGPLRERIVASTEKLESVLVGFYNCCNPFFCPVGELEEESLEGVDINCDSL